MAEKPVVTSEIAVTLKVIGGKWKPLILECLRQEGAKRYSELQRYLGSAPKKTLTAQLRELEEDGVISRTVLPAAPPQVLYALTPRGESLNPVLDAMCDWGYEHRAGYILAHPTCSEEDGA